MYKRMIINVVTWQIDAKYAYSFNIAAVVSFLINFA
jgi:hypothetical protein